MANFGERINELRTRAGLTQPELAAALSAAGELEITRSAVSMWELGKRTPKFEVLETIADYFNVDLDWLLGRSDRELTNTPPEITMIARAGAKMTPEKRADMLKILRTIYPEEFE